jgi:hypothetical protein
VTLVKVKSHTVCLLNERADELAELGRHGEGPEICPGPQKYGSFWLRARLAAREYAYCNRALGVPLPDSVHHQNIARKSENPLNIQCNESYPENGFYLYYMYYMYNMYNVY